MSDINVINVKISTDKLSDIIKNIFEKNPKPQDVLQLEQFDERKWLNDRCLSLLREFIINQSRVINVDYRKLKQAGCYEDLERLIDNDIIYFDKENNSEYITSGMINGQIKISDDLLKILCKWFN